MIAPPSGTVSFLFTDIEGSTRLWDAHPEAMRIALAQHDDLLRACIESHGGRVFKTVGDAFCAAFADPRGAVESILASQQWLPALALTTTEGSLPLKVRMALHTGVVEEREGDYFGQPLNRVARLLSTAHGGQVVVSAATQELVRDNLPQGASLRSLGEHRLKDLGRPESIFQLLHPELTDNFPALRSLDNPELKHNLPRQVTSFVGREAQIAEVKGLLESTRLLTLTGSGGSGKTRLALQVAADTLDGSGDGVWLVELAPLADPNLVPSTAANVLGLKEEAGKPILQTLTEHLLNRHLLLILDNCEHLLDACAQLADAILRSCPQVMILVTSREGLGISGEQTYRVPSLSLPDPKQIQSPETVSHYESVRLFVDRALLAQSGFQVTNQNAPALASICHRLDGIPLAIELAAARVRSLTVEDINSRLDQRFRLLTGGSRTALPRQQTLRSLIDWSYDLLNEAEKALLCRLSVFQGGWTLEAAEAVCSGEPVEHWETLDLLTSLCDKSLVVSETAGSSVRYHLLETVRQYARDRLCDEGEPEQFQKAHLRFFMELAEGARKHINLASGAEWRRKLDNDFENLRMALETACATNGDAACQLASYLADHWHNQAPTEGRVWVSRALALPCDQIVNRFRALLLEGLLAVDQFDLEVALTQFEEALRIAQELDVPALVADARFNLASLALVAGQPELAVEHYSDCLAYFQRAGDKRGISAATGNLGNALQLLGDLEEAVRLWEAAVAMNREIGNLQGISANLGNIANVKYNAGEYITARTYKAEALGLCREYGWVWGAAGCLVTLADIDILEGNYVAARAEVAEALRTFQAAGVPTGTADSLQVFAKLAVAEGDFERAAILYGAADAVFEGVGPGASGDHGHEQEAGIAKSRSALGGSAFDAAWAKGRAMPVWQAAELALTAARLPDAVRTTSGLSSGHALDQSATTSVGRADCLP